MNLPIDIYFAPIEGGEGSRREREERAVQVLVREVFGQQARRMHTASGAPYIAGAEGAANKYISISHSRLTAALAVADSPIGIDLEEDRPQLVRVAPRVLSEEELEYYGGRPIGLLEAWTLKEALFKASRELYGGEMDFTRQLHLPTAKNTTASVSDGKGAILARYKTETASLPDGQMLAAAIQC